MGVGAALGVFLHGWCEVPWSLLGSPAFLCLLVFLPGPCATFLYGPASHQGAQRPLRGQDWGWQAVGHGHSG